MKRVFIYGDSNVWGENFAGPRIPYGQRWTNRLKKLLGDDYIIIADGLCGRVAGDYRSDKVGRNGKSAFIRALEDLGHTDIVIIGLGTNDLQDKYARSSCDIIDDLLWYGSAVDNAEVIYILPPNFSNAEDSGPDFTLKSQKIRSQIIENKEKFTNYIIVNNFNLSDGVHFSSQGHKIMAETVAKKIVELA